MKIGQHDLTTTAIRHETDATERTGAKFPEAAEVSDRSKASERALMLSRNITALQNQLAARPAILDKFSGIADASLELKDEQIDTVLERMIKG